MSADEEIDRIRNRLKEHEQRITRLENLFKSKPGVVDAGGKKLSIKEFILSIKPKSDVEKTLVIGYYLENHEAFTCFNARDLQNKFREAKEPVPKNINLCATKNIGKGHMMEAGEKRDSLKAWCLTSSGEKYVESKLEKE